MSKVVESKLQTTGKIKIDKPQKEGWLEKQSRFLKTWRPRWFVLNGTILYSFKKEKEYVNPTEVIDLTVFTSVKSSEEYTNRKNSFDVYSKNMAYSMVAKTSGEKEDWIRHIGKAIIISRATFQDDYQDDDSD
ncbi:hypothetical protein AAMO2058_001599700 [Amorphochlora amoebiformis]